MTADKSAPAAPVGEVFISYSWDCESHVQAVLELSNRLRSEGIDCVLDQYEESPPEGWPLWMDKKIRDSRLVLTVCTETYYKRVMKDEKDPDTGRGVKWEGGLVYQHLYNTGTNQKFIPILFRDSDKRFIPTPLQSATHYRVDTEEGYEKLYARLLGRPSVSKPDLGAVRPMPKKEVKTDLSMYVTGPINVDLWNEARWSGILVLQYEGQPPMLGLGLALMTISSALFRHDVMFLPEHTPRRPAEMWGYTSRLCPELPENVKKSVRAAAFLRSYWVHSTGYSLERLRDAKRVYEKATSGRASDASQELHHAERAGAPQR